MLAFLFRLEFQAGNPSARTVEKSPAFFTALQARSSAVRRPSCRRAPPTKMASTRRPSCPMCVRRRSQDIRLLLDVGDDGDVPDATRRACGRHIDVSDLTTLDFQLRFYGAPEALQNCGQASIIWVWRTSFLSSEESAVVEVPGAACPATCSPAGIARA